MAVYAKIIVLGSPITKSNFKLHNTKGRAILPSSSGSYNDRYALYEQEIAYTARSQNPDIVLDESLIAVLNVYYKSEKRHPDTINITKSIFDGIEKSGLIVNDAQIRRIITEEFYDKENPRFELELFGESAYSLSYSLEKKTTLDKQILYSSLKKSPYKNKVEDILTTSTAINKTCSYCKIKISSEDYISGDKGKTLICKECFNKLF